MLITDTHIKREIERDLELKILFSDSGDIRKCKSIKNLNFEYVILEQKFLYHIFGRESKNTTFSTMHN